MDQDTQVGQPDGCKAAHPYPTPGLATFLTLSDVRKARPVRVAEDPPNWFSYFAFLHLANPFRQIITHYFRH